MDTQKDGLENVSPFICGHFGVCIYMLNCLGCSQSKWSHHQFLHQDDVTWNTWKRIVALHKWLKKVKKKMMVQNGDLLWKNPNKIITFSQTTGMATTKKYRGFPPSVDLTENCSRPCDSPTFPNLWHRWRARSGGDLRTGFAIITWNNPKKLEKPYFGQYPSISRVDFPM